MKTAVIGIEDTAAISASSIYQPLNQARKEIRVATIAPNADSAAPIDVSLKVLSLDEDPLYTALSYCWASLKGTEDVTLCGYQFSVTKNLCEALQQFRSKESTICIWVDALCINQKDMQERSSQVALMREVYTKAEVVNIWLGPATSQTEVGLNYLRYIMTCPDIDDSLDHIPEEFGTGSEFLALGAIFRNPYWHRRWITQEIVVSRFISMHCGGFQIGPFKFFESHGIPAIATYVDRCRNIAMEQYRPQGIYFDIVNDETGAIHDTLYVLVEPDHGMNTAQLIAFFRSVASVDHDYVYGLLVLLPEDIGVVPNYDLDIREVFADFAHRFMKQYEVIHLLYLAGHGTGELPSWVVDLRYPQIPAYDRGVQADPGVRALSLYASLFDASAGARLDIQNRIGVRLVISGLVIDKIIALGTKLHLREDGLIDPAQAFAAFAQWQDPCRKLAREQSIVDPIAYDDHITMDLVRAICADVSQDLNAVTRLYRRCPPAELEEYRLGLEYWWGLYQEGEDYLDALLSSSQLAAEWAFATGEVRVVDHICILAGSPLPMHLRRVEDSSFPTYTYGCAYVQGIMDGEAVLEGVGGNRAIVNEVFEEIHLV